MGRWGLDLGVVVWEGWKLIGWDGERERERRVETWTYGEI